MGTGSWRPATTSGRSSSPRRLAAMTSQHPHDRPDERPGEAPDDPRVTFIGTTSDGEGEGEGDEGERNIAELVEQPAKVMRIGGMIRQLLEEVKSAPLDEA